MQDGDSYTFGSAGGVADANSGATGTDSVIVPAFLGGNSNAGGSGDGGGEQFDPAIHAGPDKRNADGSYRRKRGRKSGSANRGNSTAQNSVGLEALVNILSIVHLGIAAVSHTPELKLTDDEAKSLAEATVTVLNEFDIRPDPKVTAVVGLITTAGVIYTPKIYFMRERWKEEARAKVVEDASA